MSENLRNNEGALHSVSTVPPKLLYQISIGERSKMLDDFIKERLTVSHAKVVMEAIGEDPMTLNKDITDRESYIMSMIVHMQAIGMSTLWSWLKQFTVIKAFKKAAAAKWLYYIEHRQFPTEEQIVDILGIDKGDGLYVPFDRPSEEDIFALMADCIKNNIDEGAVETSLMAIDVPLSMVEKSDDLADYLSKLIMALMACQKLGSWLYVLAHANVFKKEFALTWLAKLNAQVEGLELPEINENTAVSYVGARHLILREKAELAQIASQAYLTEEELDTVLLSMDINPMWIKWSTYMPTYLYNVINHLNDCGRIGEFLYILGYKPEFNKTFAKRMLDTLKTTDFEETLAEANEYLKAVPVREVDVQELACMALDFTMNGISLENAKLALAAIGQAPHRFMKQTELVDLLLMILQYLDSQSLIGEWLKVLAITPSIRKDVALVWLRRIATPETRTSLESERDTDENSLNLARIEDFVYENIDLRDMDIIAMAELTEDCLSNHVTLSQAQVALRLAGIQVNAVEKDEDYGEYLYRTLATARSRGRLGSFINILGFCPLFKKEFVGYWLQNFATGSFANEITTASQLKKDEVILTRSLLEAGRKELWQEKFTLQEVTELAECFFYMRVSIGQILAALRLAGVHDASITNSKDLCVYFSHILFYLKARGKLHMWLYILGVHPRIKNDAALHWCMKKSTAKYAHLFENTREVDPAVVDHDTTDKEILAQMRAHYDDFEYPRGPVLSEMLSHFSFYGITREQLLLALGFMDCHPSSISGSSSNDGWHEKVIQYLCPRGMFGELLYILATKRRFRRSFAIYWLRRLGGQKVHALISNLPEVTEEAIKPPVDPPLAFCRRVESSVSTIGPRDGILLAEAMTGPGGISYEQAKTAMLMMGLPTGSLAESGLGVMAMNNLVCQIGPIYMASFLYLVATHKKFGFPFAAKNLPSFTDEVFEPGQLTPKAKDDHKIQRVLPAGILAIPIGTLELSQQASLADILAENMSLEQVRITLAYIGVDLDAINAQGDSDRGFFSNLVQYLYPRDLLGTWLFQVAIRPGYQLEFAREFITQYAIESVDFEAGLAAIQTSKHKQSKTQTALSDETDGKKLDLEEKIKSRRETVQAIAEELVSSKLELEDVILAVDAVEGTCPPTLVAERHAIETSIHPEELKAHYADLVSLLIASGKLKVWLKVIAYESRVGHPWAETWYKKLSVQLE